MPRNPQKERGLAPSCQEEGAAVPGQPPGRRLLRAVARSTPRPPPSVPPAVSVLRGGPPVAAGGEGAARAALPSPEARAGRPGPLREGGRGCGQRPPHTQLSAVCGEVVEPPAASQPCSAKPEGPADVACRELNALLTNFVCVMANGHREL